MITFLCENKSVSSGYFILVILTMFFFFKLQMKDPTVRFWTDKRYRLHF